MKKGVSWWAAGGVVIVAAIVLVSYLLIKGDKTPFWKDKDLPRHTSAPAAEKLAVRHIDVDGSPETTIAGVTRPSTTLLWAYLRYVTPGALHGRPRISACPPPKLKKSRSRAAQMSSRSFCIRSKFY